MVMLVCLNWSIDVGRILVLVVHVFLSHVGYVLVPASNRLCFWMQWGVVTSSSRHRTEQNTGLDETKENIDSIVVHFPMRYSH